MGGIVPFKTTGKYFYLSRNREIFVLVFLSDASLLSDVLLKQNSKNSVYFDWDENYGDISGGRL